MAHRLHGGGHRFPRGAQNDVCGVFEEATLNPRAELVTGVICGYRIEELDNELTRKVRVLDKLVDELAKGRAMEKILR